jgi:hypothetical protein
MTASSIQSGGLNQCAKDQYLLFYRGFIHLSLKMIIYTVITVDQSIKIPKDLEIYEICAIAKMNNTISKTLTNHIVSKLTLI